MSIFSGEFQNYDEFSRGIWSPTTRAWRDVVEDYLYISRKRIDNKLSLFKLQLQILMDIINNVNFIDSYKKKLNEFVEDKEKGSMSLEEFEFEEKHINSEIFSLELINKSLREIIDGIVWKNFNFNRAMLYMLADKEPIESIRLDVGMIKTLNEFAEIFLKPKDYAIINDISNFLRIGDITHIDENNNINFIEVKSSKSLRGARIARQKQRMSELVEFFNTGNKEYDGKKLKIFDSSVKQRNYLSQLYDSILRAKNRGYDSILIGNYIIVEICDFSKFKKIDTLKKYFSSKHDSVKEKWHKNNDLVFRGFFTDKLAYSKNFAPYSIYPFDVQTCTDIIMGRLWISTLFNHSEIFKILEKNGWEIIDALHFKSNDDIAKINKTNLKNVDFIKVGKDNFTFVIDPGTFGRLEYELLSPQVILGHLNEMFKQDPDEMNDILTITNNLDERNIWHS